MAPPPALQPVAPAAAAQVGEWNNCLQQLEHSQLHLDREETEEQQAVPRRRTAESRLYRLRVELPCEQPVDHRVLVPVAVSSVSRVVEVILVVVVVVVVAAAVAVVPLARELFKQVQRGQSQYFLSPVTVDAVVAQTTGEFVLVTEAAAVVVADLRVEPEVVRLHQPVAPADLVVAVVAH